MGRRVRGRPAFCESGPPAEARGVVAPPPQNVQLSVANWRRKVKFWKGAASLFALAPLLVLRVAADLWGDLPNYAGEETISGFTELRWGFTGLLWGDLPNYAFEVLGSVPISPITQRPDLGASKDGRRRD